jgi:hypothetical protein
MLEQSSRSARRPAWAVSTGFSNRHRQQLILSVSAGAPGSRVLSAVVALDAACCLVDGNPHRCSRRQGRRHSVKAADQAALR